MKNSIIFTRYLYIYQEVCASLLVELLRRNNTDFKNVIFWLNELYYSGFHDELWCLCLKFYYWFYYDTHPHMEKYLVKQIDKYIELKNNYLEGKTDEEVVEKQIIKLVLSTYKNLFSKNKSIDIDYCKNVVHYHIVNSIVEKYGEYSNTNTNATKKNNKNKISLEEKLQIKKSKGRKTRFVMNFIKMLDKNPRIELTIERTRKIKHFVCAFEKNDIKTIYYYSSLYVKEKTPEQMLLIQVMLEFYRYIHEVNNMELNPSYIKQKMKLMKYNLYNYLDKEQEERLQIKTIMCCIVFDCYNLLNNKINNTVVKDTVLKDNVVKDNVVKDKEYGVINGLKPKKKHIYITANKRDVDTFECKYFNIDDLGEGNAWKILKQANTLKICDEVALFNLNRDYYDDDELRDMLWYHWEYYTNGCPLWVMRVQEYGGYYDNKDKTIRFHSNSAIILQEKFYDMFGLEPDEQSREKQDNILLLNEINETNTLYKRVLFNNNDINSIVNFTFCEYEQQLNFDF